MSSNFVNLVSQDRSNQKVWCVYGVVRCGVVRCGEVRCGVVWCGMVWGGVVW